MTYPTEQGSNGYVLTTDGDDNISWKQGGSGGGVSFEKETEDVYVDVTDVVINYLTVDSGEMFIKLIVRGLYVSNNGSDYERAVIVELPEDIVNYLTKGYKFYEKKTNTFFYDQDGNPFMPAGEEKSESTLQYSLDITDSSVIYDENFPMDPSYIKSIDLEYQEGIVFSLTSMTVDGAVWDADAIIAEIGTNASTCMDYVSVMGIAYYLVAGEIPIAIYVSPDAKNIESSPFYQTNYEGMYLMNMGEMATSISAFTVKVGGSNTYIIPSEFTQAKEPFVIDCTMFGNDDNAPFIATGTKYIDVVSAILAGRPLKVNAIAYNSYMSVSYTLSDYCMYSWSGLNIYFTTIATMTDSKYVSVGTLSESDFNNGWYYYRPSQSSGYYHATEYDSSTEYYKIVSTDFSNLGVSTLKISEDTETGCAVLVMNARQIGENFIINGSILKTYNVNGNPKNIYRADKSRDSIGKAKTSGCSLVLRLTSAVDSNQKVELKCCDADFESDNRNTKADKIYFTGVEYANTIQYEQVDSVTAENFVADTLYYYNSNNSKYELVHEYDSSKTYYIRTLTTGTTKYTYLACIDCPGSYPTQYSGYLDVDTANIMVDIKQETIS